MMEVSPSPLRYIKKNSLLNFSSFAYFLFVILVMWITLAINQKASVSIFITSKPKLYIEVI